MLTLGIDFASQPKNTAAALLNWEFGRAILVSLTVPADDNALTALSTDADKIGIDIPLGWPESFIDAINKHRAAEEWPASSTHALRFRATDLFVHSRIKKWPLSVSSDRIGVPAFRAARLAPKLAGSKSVDRTGGGRMVEVYPKAALLRWRIELRDKEHTDLLFADLCAATSEWLHISDQQCEKLQSNRDALDSLICALIARAAALGFCESIPPESLPLAQREGWIALPVQDSLAKLPRDGITK